MRPAEFVEAMRGRRPPLLLPAKLPSPGDIKEIARRASKEADPPWTAEEFVWVMKQLGLRPGWD